MSLRRGRGLGVEARLAVAAKVWHGRGVLFDPPAVDEVSAALGLRPTGALLTERAGVVDGVPVRLRGLLSRRSDLDLVVEARPSFGLDLGLWVRQAGLVQGGPARVETGDPAFDGVCEVTVAAGGADAVRALLDDATRATLLGMLVAGRPEITDEVVALNLSSLYLTAESLTARVRECVRVARAMDALGARLPPPAGIGAEHAAAFGAACREHGLAFRAHPLGASGDTRESAVWVRWRTHPAVRSIASVLEDSVELAGYRVVARFHEALGAGLRVEPAGLSDRLKDLVGLGDLRLGAEAFDAAWRVRAATPDAATALLHEGARAGLERLRALGLRLTLDDAGVDGRGDLPSDPGCVPEVLRLVVDLRDALRQRASRGAYR